MSQAASQSTSKLKKAGLFIAITLAVCLVLGAVAYWLVVPGVADKLVRDKLAAVEKKLDVRIEMEEVATTGISAVTLRGFKLLDAATEESLAEVGSVSATIDAFELLRGNRELSGVTIEDATLYVRRYADGSTNLERLLERRGQDEQAGDETSEQNKEKKKESSAAGSGSTASFLRFFGGEWPSIDVTNAQVVLTAEEGAEPWPVDELSTEKFALDSSGQTASLKTAFTLARGTANPRWSIPETIDVDATLRVPLLASTARIDFATPLELVDFEPFPFLRVGVGGFAVESDNTLSVHDLSLDVQGGAEPTRVASIERIAASLRSLDPSLEDLRLMEVRIENPHLTIDHDAQSGSGLSDLNHLLRSPLAGHVSGQAKGVIKAIAEKKGIELEEEEEKKGGGLRAMLAQINWSEFLGKQAPQQLIVEGATVEVTDKRPLPLETSDQKLALRDGRFRFSHRAIHGELVFSAGFKAEANDGEPRGEVDADFTWNYRDKAMELDANVDALSLPWVVQMTRGDLAEKVRAGTVRADLKMKRKAKKRQVDFSGLVSVEDGTFFVAAVTEEPIEDLTASYVFDATYDPKAVVPEPKLLAQRAIPVEQVDEKLDAAGEKAADATKSAANNNESGNEENAEDAEPLPPSRGAFVVSRGEAKLNGVEGEFRPALYGLDGLKRRPARVDLHVRLPESDVMALFDAVPDAIKGPVTGTKMKGTFEWTLDVEVPLYAAGNMKWDSKPVIKDFELLSMPEQVDVRKLRDEFELTLYDPAIEWERKVTVPEMRPVPVDFLVRHSGLSAEQFEKRRKEREWPPRYAKNHNPDPDNDGVVNRLMPHKAPWDDQAASTSTLIEPSFGEKPSVEPLEETSQASTVSTGAVAPEKPMVRWEDETKEHPYGHYTYVPLQYISPWMIRAAMTTEDNSFFTHHGFNWFAIKDSIEDNLEAGRYVRGASTISMQLVKNVFLNRKKVLARKVQEAFLVWLMEDVADIPKARLLELYFNVIEYGPGIYGIHDAAVHYFGKRPDRLTLTEVAWLVSIVPNPKKYHIYYERGGITDAWFRHMLRYVRVMHNRGRVTEFEYEMAKQAKPEFYKPADGEPKMRLERDPEEVEALTDDDGSIRIPGIKDLFGP